MEWKHISLPPESIDEARTGSVEIFVATFCKPCGKLFDKETYCPCCLHVYSDDSVDLEMACCDVCDR
jgi:hypothetical protein